MMSNGTREEIEQALECERYTMARQALLRRLWRFDCGARSGAAAETAPTEESHRARKKHVVAAHCAATGNNGSHAIGAEEPEAAAEIKFSESAA